MIGNMITKIRTEKGMTKTELARLTGINIGHITHIEKGERNPSHKVLKKICSALEVPYQPLMYTYDKQINEEQENYNIINYIPYNKVMAFENFGNLIDCPPSMNSASLAIKMPDASMQPLFNEGDYLFVEFNSPISNNDIGIFSLNNNILVRKFVNKHGIISLQTINKDSPKCVISDDDKFFIIGKILNIKK